MDIETIKQWLRENPQKVSIFVEPNSGDSRGKTLESLTLELTSAGLFLAHPFEEMSKPEEGPFMAFASGLGPPRHYYQALPTGKEWESFLGLIKALSSGTTSLFPDSLDTLKGLNKPHLIRVLVTSSCPFCARMVGLVNQLAAASSLITAWIIDVELFPEWVGRYQLKSVPTTIIGEEVFLTGLVNEKDLIDWLQKMDSQEYLGQLYRNDLLEKKLSQAVERLKQRPQDLPLMAYLLKAEEFGVKLGAMAVIEQLSDEEAHLHGAIFESLAPLLLETADTLIGDVIYLLGPLHDPRKAPALEKFLVHSNPEIEEAAREATASR
jgi:hypothetical protein